MDKLLDIETKFYTSTYHMKSLAAMYSLIYGFNGLPISAERVFIINQYNYKLYFYGYCKQPFPSLKVKDFEVKTSGILYCYPEIRYTEVMNSDGG